MMGSQLNCAITVNGSWCRPTISLPNTRSDGDRSTGTAMARVTISAHTETPATSAAAPVIRHHSQHQNEGARDGPRAHVAHVRQQSAMVANKMQHREQRDLRERQKREARHERPQLEHGEDRHGKQYSPTKRRRMQWLPGDRRGVPRRQSSPMSRRGGQGPEEIHKDTA